MSMLSRMKLEKAIRRKENNKKYASLKIKKKLAITLESFTTEQRDRWNAQFIDWQAEENRASNLRLANSERRVIGKIVRWSLAEANTHMREWARERGFETDTRVGQSMVNMKNTI